METTENVEENTPTMLQMSIEPRNKGKKRAREVRDVRSFLSLEAEVESDEDEDEDEEDDLDDFLQDDEPVAADRSVSRRLLLREHARAQAEGEWDALLSRARERAQEDSWDEEAHAGHDAPFVGEPEVRLWRVRVKPGWEETAAFVLMEKIVRSGFRWTISSIIGRVSRPGWIVIEAPSASEVQAVCQGMLNIFSQQIQVVEPADGPSCLRERISFTPRPSSWVRLAKHPYKGDLAYVRGTSNKTSGEISVLVVPRLNLQRRRRRVGQSQKRQHTGRVRPPPALFDANSAREIFGGKAVVTDNQVFRFKGKEYMDGYLCLDTGDFYPQEALPTPEELDHFQRLPNVPDDFFKHTAELMAARRICVGDPVKVVEGDAQGITGIVGDITSDEAVLRTSLDNLELALPITALRKSMTVGDEVVVAFGSRKGFTGWIVSVLDENLVLYNHETAEEVETTASCVNFWHAPLEFGRSLATVETQQEADQRHARERMLTVAAMESLSPLPAAKLQDEIDKLRRDPNRHLVGRRVQVVAKHRRRDCVGTIKSTQEGDHVMVDFNDDLPSERFHLNFLLDCIEKKTLGRDPNRHLIGRHVRIVKHRLRDYEGIIKSTQQDDHVLVEIQATMKQERLHISNLTLLEDYKLRTLGKPPAENSTASTSEIHRETPEVPETTEYASTPLPPPSNALLSPAWDPSSRTPNPNGLSAQNAWMESIWFTGKRVKLQITNTKHTSDDPGWKSGEYEDRFGLWLGTEGTNVKVVLGLRNTVVLPERYVRTVPPSVKGQSVVVLNGLYAGQEYYVVDVGEECVVGRRRNGKMDPKSKMSFLSTNLAVIA